MSAGILQKMAGFWQPEGGAVGGERESYFEPKFPVTSVTCSTGKSPMPVTGARGSKLELSG